MVYVKPTLSIAVPFIIIKFVIICIFFCVLYNVRNRDQLKFNHYSMQVHCACTTIELLHRKAPHSTEFVAS